MEIGARMIQSKDQANPNPNPTKLSSKSMKTDFKLYRAKRSPKFKMSDIDIVQEISQADDSHIFNHIYIANLSLDFFEKVVVIENPSDAATALHVCNQMYTEFVEA